MARVVEIQPKKDTSLLSQALALFDTDIDKAFEKVNEFLMREPNDAQALVLAASILKKAKKLPIAYSLAKRATELKPERPEVWECYGLCAQQLWRMEEAIPAHRKALQRAQTNKQKATYLNNLASAHLDQGDFAKAEPFCRQSVELTPEAMNPRHNLGLALLAQRKWKEAWPFYSASLGGEHRRLQKYRPKGSEEPTWDGAKGQTVAVYGEQGLGDEICAASMLPDVIRDSKKVIVDCDVRLKGLFSRSFPAATVHGTRWEKQISWNPTEIDASVAGFEVAKFYRNSDEDFPDVPYLVPCPDRLQMWKALFAGKKKPVIGIAWSGGTWHNAALHRHLPLKEWQPIFDAVDAHWVCLQYKDAGKEIEGTSVTQYPWATLTKDYDDTAALVASCDLVIGMQTSVNHLAGALGVPVWTMIPSTSQWRYGEDYASIPWYGSMRLFRQAGDWKPTVKQIATELRTHFA